MPYHKAETAEAYVKTHPMWSEELITLRNILIDTELNETVKWGMPTYTIGGKNVIGLAGFKNHFSLWFHKGGSIPDPDQILINAQEGKTKDMRHLKYKSGKEIKKTQIKKYVLEAIRFQKEWNNL